MLQNTGSTLDINGAASTWSMEQGNSGGGGAIVGGDLLVRNGGHLNITQGTLRGVNLTGNIGVTGNNNRLNIIDSLHLNGEVTVGTAATLNITSSGPSDDTVLVTGGSIRLNRGTSGYNDAITVTGNRTLQLSPTTTLHGGNGWVGRRILPSTFT